MLKLILRLLTIITNEQQKVKKTSVRIHEDVKDNVHNKRKESSTLIDNTSGRKAPLDKDGNKQIKPPTVSSTNETEYYQSSSAYPQNQQFKLDGLGYLQQQIANNVQHLLEGFIQPKDLYLKVKPPAITREVDKLVTVISAIAKLHVAEVVTEALQSVERRSGPASQSTLLRGNQAGGVSGQIEPRDLKKMCYRRKTISS